MLKIPMTVKGATSLRQELEKLKTKDRPAIIKAIGGKNNDKSKSWNSL